MVTASRITHHEPGLQGRSGHYLGLAPTVSWFAVPNAP